MCLMLAIPLIYEQGIHEQARSHKQETMHHEKQ